jgi:hypothetical protein
VTLLERRELLERALADELGRVADHKEHRATTRTAMGRGGRRVIVPVVDEAELLELTPEELW